jgi:hypothetical protein
VAERARGACRRVGAIAGGTLLTLTAACGSGDSASVVPSPVPDDAATASAKPQPSGPRVLSIRHNQVTPSTLEVEGGATVRIRNDDSVRHRLDNRENHLYAGSIEPHGKGEITAPPDPGNYVFTDPNYPSVRLRLKVR